MSQTLDGADGNDLLDGRIGNDILTGGGGLNTFVGGDGADIVAISGQTGEDRILGFVTGADKIKLAASDFGFASGQELAFLSANSTDTLSLGTNPTLLCHADMGAFLLDFDGAGGRDPVGLGFVQTGLATTIDDFLWV